MFYSEELINAYVPQTIVAEYTTYGQRILELYIAGIYEIKCVGAGGLSTGIYSGDSAYGGWTGFQVSTGGCGGYVSTEVFLKPDKYIITVGALGGGTDLTSTTYSGVKTPGSSQGSSTTSTYIQNSAGDVLVVAGGGGESSYGYSGNQKNDGARYVYTAGGAGGGYSVNVTPNWNTTAQNGEGSAISTGGDWSTSASRNATYNGYGKPNNVSGSYGGYYNVSYTVSGGTGGYFRLKYLRSNA